MVERDYHFSEEKKGEIQNTLWNDRRLPTFPCEVERVSYLDGCKVYFKDGGWVIARFSGTEPLLRIFCEMPDRAAAKDICKTMEGFLGL